MSPGEQAIYDYILEQNDGEMQYRITENLPDSVE